MHSHRTDDLSNASTSPSAYPAPGKVTTTSKLAPRRDAAPMPTANAYAGAAPRSPVPMSADESRVAALSGLPSVSRAPLDAGDTTDAGTSIPSEGAPPAPPAKPAALPFTVGGFPSSVDAANSQPKFSGTPLPGSAPPLVVDKDVVFSPSIVAVVKVLAAAGYGPPSSSAKPTAAKTPAAPAASTTPATPGAPATPAAPKPAPTAAIQPTPPALAQHVGEPVHRAGDPYTYQVTADGNFLITAAPAGMPIGATIKQKGGMILVWQDLCKSLLGADCFSAAPGAPAAAPAATPNAPADAPAAAPATTPAAAPAATPAATPTAAPAAPAAPKAPAQWTLDDCLDAIWGAVPAPPPSLADPNAVLDWLLGTSPTPPAAAPAAAPAATSDATPAAPADAPAAPAPAADAPYLPAGTPITSGLRTDDDQAALIVRHAGRHGLVTGNELVDGDLHKTFLALRKTGEKVAWVGDSLHRSGLAIDFSTSRGPTEKDIVAGLQRLRAEHPELGLGEPYPETQPCVHQPLTK